MPRVSNIYSVPPGTDAVPNTTIASVPYNTFIHDVETDLNTPRPVVAGGTGANNAANARTNLGIDEALAGSLGSGLITLTGGTTINFVPYNGDKVRINGKLYQIPAAGVSAGSANVFINGALGNLAAGTNYYVYLFDNGGTLTIDYSTTGHSTSTTAGNVGTRIKTGNDTRSLIGFVRCSTPPTNPFYNDTKFRWVRSWFNRQAERLDMTNNFSAQRATSSSSPVEMNAEIRIAFLVWANEALSLAFTCPTMNDTAGKFGFFTVGIDANINPGGNYAHALIGGNSWQPASYPLHTQNISEGNHYATVFGFVDPVSTMYMGLTSSGIFGTLTGIIHH
jgi:hypothetical protein